MQIPKTSHSFDVNHVQEILIKESKFISDLFSILSLPTRNESGNDFENVEGERKTFSSIKKHSRAQSLTELQERLKAITDKKKLSYKEKLTKKSLKSRLKKKSKQDVRKIQRVEVASKPAKPVFNSAGKMVFSKFDFTNVGVKREKKMEKDPKKILKKLEEDREVLADLEQKGEVGAVVSIKEKKAWKNALAKAQGVKVKDDEGLLKKSVKKMEQQKRTSKKKWAKRMEGVEKGKKERQEKRRENIDKRKKEKKVKTMKKASKRGKIIPGF